jgi:hypothetical protein
MRHTRGQGVVTLPLVCHHPVDQGLVDLRVVIGNQHVVERQVVERATDGRQLEATGQPHVQVIEWAQHLDHRLEIHHPCLLVGLLIPTCQHADQGVATPGQCVVGDAKPLVIRVARHQLAEVIDRVILTPRPFAILESLHQRGIGGRGGADCHTRRNAWGLLAHKDETRFNGVRHPEAEQDAVRHVGRCSQGGRVAFDDDALQQLLGAAVLLLLQKQHPGNATASERRIHAGVARVVHALGLAVDVHIVTRYHRQAGDHARMVRIFDHGENLLITDDAGTHKEIGCTLEAQLGRPWHGDLAHQTLDAGVVRWGAEADSQGHENSFQVRGKSVQARSSACLRTVGTAPDQCRSGSILMLPSIMPRSRHCAR